ncbi:MAG: small multi-drug export protein [Firmicutes bacterium]|nr:small multi-drug export protein [Bacillota bacterium]
MGIPAGWRVLVLSMLPVTELRGAIPLGVLWGLKPVICYFWAVTGNFIPVIPLLLGLKLLFRCILRRPRWQGIVSHLNRHTAGNQEKVRRYGMLGLTLLVAVPLPGTGVWTGALVAALLNLRFRSALLAITLGELIAGILVCLVVRSAIAVSQLQYGAWIVLGIVLFLFFLVLKKKFKK